VPNVHGKVFPGYGRCIYCGAIRGLKDEHIVPLSLGGTAVIEKASCGDCEKITSYLDGYLARDIFNEYRSHIGIRSRRPKQRPKSLFASFLKPDGSEVVEEFSPKDQPYVLLMPIWNVPGIALGKPPTADFDVTQGHLYLFASEGVQKRIAAEGMKLGVWPYINYPTFARRLPASHSARPSRNSGLMASTIWIFRALFSGPTPTFPTTSA
jgi:HNH endonuclease